MPLFSSYEALPLPQVFPIMAIFLHGTIKDVVFRYKTMKGFYVPRRFGWDCHGLPIENEIEKAKQFRARRLSKSLALPSSTKSAVKSFSVIRKNGNIRVNRMGRWVILINTYRTMDNTFMESVWWVFKQLYEKGLVYEGLK